jgi:cyclic pyranopterin phosphate synthase
MKLIDAHNRRLNYFRISITDRCNLRCQYCSPRHHTPMLAHEDILRYEEILHLIRISVRLGISKVRITGGEPLTRKGVCEFIRAVNQVEGIRDVSLTTNGVLLKNRVDALIIAGLRRINISLDTLNPEKFKIITGVDAFDQVWEGILKAYQAGISPIKINTVALRHVNENELEDIARLSFTYPFHFRFIEYMPIGITGKGLSDSLYTPEIKQILADRVGRLIPVEHQNSDGPADRFRFEGAVGEVGFISAMSHHFCHTCNRLRLTASGQLRSCLLSDHQQDLKTPLRSGASDEALAAIFLKAASSKGIQHRLTADALVQVSSRMSSIGG